MDTGVLPFHMRLGPILDVRQGGRVSLSWTETVWQPPGQAPGQAPGQGGRLVEQGMSLPSALPCTSSALPTATTMPREDLFSGNPLNPENDGLDPYAGLSPREKLNRLNQTIGRMDRGEQEARKTLRKGQEQFVRMEQTARRLGIEPLDPVAVRAEAEGRASGGGGGGRGGGGSSPGVIDVQAEDITNAPPPTPARPAGRSETPAERFRRERPGRQARRQRAADETQARLNTAESVANNPFTSRLSSEDQQRIRDLDRAAGVLRSLDPSTVLPPAQEPKFVDITAQVVQEQRVLPAGTQTTLRERARALGQRADREFVGIREGLGRAEAATNRTRNIAARRQTDFGINRGKCGGREQPRDSRGRFSTCN